MDSTRLRKNEIEDQLQDSSDSESDADEYYKKLRSKINDGKSPNKKLEGFHSRKRKADSVEEAKPAKISRNTPSKNRGESVFGLPTSFSPGQRSSPRNVQIQPYGSPNKFVVSEGTHKLSAKKKLFESETQQTKALVVSCSKLETPNLTESTGNVLADENQALDDSGEIFISKTKHKKSKCLDKYSVKLPSKTSPLKVTLVKDSPARKRNVDSPASNHGVSTTSSKKTPTKPLSKANKETESESESEESEGNKDRTEGSNEDHEIRSKYFIQRAKEMRRLNIDMKESAISPSTDKRMKSKRQSYVEDPLSSPEKSDRRSKSSSKSKQIPQTLFPEVETSVSEFVKLKSDRLKVDKDQQPLTPRRPRRSSVTFSPLPPKHRSTRSELFTEDSCEMKSPSRTSTRRSLIAIKENISENTDHITPTKQRSSKKKSSYSSASKDEDADNKDNCSTPLQRKSVSVTTPVSKKNSGRGFLTPSMARKESSSSRKEDELDATRRQLHISTVPKSLPCRDNEFSQIKSFLTRKIEHLSGGCMYISGVPGTGKTATVHAVVRSLQEHVDNGELSDFDFVEVNGLRLTEPKQAYVRIYQALTDKKLTPDQAQQLLSRKFSGNCKKSTIILVDELDYLCNRRQDVVYNILDWPTKRGSALVVLTISNTMDLAERTLKGRVTSRMGLTRLTFQPYSHHQLQEIVLDRLCGSATFHPDAVQLVARKVAAVSGDARRALDICRRTTELVSSGEQVTAAHVQKALMQIFSGPRVLVIQRLSGQSQLVLRCLRDVSHTTGIEESTVAQLYRHLEQICVLENVTVPSVGAVLQTCVSLVNLGLMVAERGRNDINRKLSLNVSSDDIHYALDNVRSL